MYDIQQPLHQLKLGQAADAIPMLETLVKRTPGHVTAHVLLARAYQAEERWEDAMGSWQNASFLMPSSPVIAKGFKDVLAILSDDLSVEESHAKGEDEEYEVVSVKIKAPPSAAPAIDEPISTEAEDAVVQADEPAALTTLDPFVQAEEESIEDDQDMVEFVTDFEEPEPEEPISPEDLMHLPPMVRDVATRAPVQPSEPAGHDDLDRLIQELETARIVPKPDHEDLAAPAMENSVEGMASETLATIYAAQRQYEAAARVYEELARMHPEKAESYEAKAADMRSKG